MYIHVYVCIYICLYMYAYIYLYIHMFSDTIASQWQRYVRRFFLCWTLFPMFYIPCCVVCLKPQLTLLGLKRLYSLSYESLSVDPLEGVKETGAM